MAARYTPDSRVGSLPHSLMSTVGRMLLHSESWKQLASQLTYRNGQPMFTYDDILCLELYGLKAPNELLKNITTGNFTVREFIECLRQARLYRAADYVSKEALRGGEVERLPGDLPVPVPDAPDATETGSETFQVLYDRVSGKPNRPEVEEEYFLFSVGEIKEKPLEGTPPSATLSSPATNSPVPIESEEENMSQTLQYIPGHPHRFDYSHLSDLTGEFDRNPRKDGGYFVGRGGFSEVFYARLQLTSSVKELAVKRLTDSTMFSESQLRTEVEAMSRYNHENLLPLLGYADSGTYRCIVYAFMSNGSLEERLAVPDGYSPLTVSQRMSILEGTARGIYHLHTARDEPLIHRDIKSANILLDENLMPKLGDFGLARVGPSLDGPDTSRATQLLQGTTAYMPPECLSMRISIKWDVFSFGVVLLELLTGLPPFDRNRAEFNLQGHVAEQGDDIMDMIDQKAGPWPKSVAQSIFSIANRCLETKPRHRPTMKMVLADIEAIQI